VFSARQAPDSGVIRDFWRSVMKIRFRSFLVLAGLLVLNASAVSVAQTTDTVSNVPFAFNVGSAVLPRDTYRITKVSGHMSAYQIRGLHAAAIMISQPDGRDAADPSPRLVFHRIGAKYFLREVRLTGNAGFTLPASRAEVEAAEQIGAEAAPETIVVPAR
jgi:hypothetical protein